jgi:hypothetical protein
MRIMATVGGTQEGCNMLALRPGARDKRAHGRSKGNKWQQQAAAVWYTYPQQHKVNASRLLRQTLSYKEMVCTTGCASYLVCRSGSSN